MALSNKDIGGFNKLWCMNFTTSFSLLIWWYKKEACSVVSLLTILVGVVLQRNILFGNIVCGHIVWDLLDGNIVLDDSIVRGVWATVLLGVVWAAILFWTAVLFCWTEILF